MEVPRSRAGKIAKAGAANGRPQALRLERETAPDIAIVDIGLSGLNGIDLTVALKRQSPKLQFLILMHDREMLVYAAIEADASGFLHKSDDEALILSVIGALSVGRSGCWERNPVGTVRRCPSPTSSPAGPALAPPEAALGSGPAPERLGIAPNRGITWTITLDLALFPTPTGFVAVQAGDTWHVTAWHRDAIGGVATSNFADGLSIAFN